MIKLLLIADDFTGALDSCVQFSKQHVSSFVSVNGWIDPQRIDPEVEILAISTESRHRDAADAYEEVAALIRKARKAAIPYVYKKTDSALRGNIGSELKAVLDYSGVDAIPFIPAFPSSNRITVGGIQLINGVPVSRSSFATDPFAPVKRDSIAEIIRAQADVDVFSVKPGDALGERKGVYVYDCGSDRELEYIGRTLQAGEQLGVSAGCAGFAYVLSQYLPFTRGFHAELPVCGKMLIVSGSVNAAAIAQLDYVRSRNVRVFSLSSEQKLGKNAAVNGFAARVARAVDEENIAVVAATSGSDDLAKTQSFAESHGIRHEEIRERTMHNIGALTREIASLCALDCIMVIGGDTLRGVIDEFHGAGIVPYGEVADATVLSRFINDSGERLWVISKSGGLGPENVIWNACKMVRGMDVEAGAPAFADKQSTQL